MHNYEKKTKMPRVILTPVRQMVKKRKTSLAAAVLTRGWKTRPVRRLPTRYPRNPKVHTKFTVSMATPVFLQTWF
jgi:hypothetical protein